jgi:hypothetical protein
MLLHRRIPSYCCRLLVLCDGKEVRPSPARAKRSSALTLGPQLDRPERLPEDRHVWYEPQDRIRHARSSQTPHAALVEVLEEAIVAKREVVGHGGKSEASEEEIELDTSNDAGDDGYEGVRHRLQGEESGQLSW